MKQEYKTLKPYLLFWGTQTLSTLGSGMTSYALVLWLYLQSGSALQTALLSVASYTPYVLASVFAGVLSDRWDKKRTILGCDLIAALSTLAVLGLLWAGRLRRGHLYLVNALAGLMNSVQQPAGEVLTSLLVPRQLYQKTSGLRSFSQSLNSILTPVLATALFAAGGMPLIIAVDLCSFAAAFFTLWLAIPVPKALAEQAPAGGLLAPARAGLRWLWGHRLVLKLILFLAAINLVASAYSAALPALVLPGPGGEAALGFINACAGAATLAGSLLPTLLPAPKNRVRAICLCLLVSMSSENFLLAFGKTPLVWCAGAVAGWLLIPTMNANLDVICRSSIPTAMQGRVYACRNTLQFFTIPVGYFLGGLLTEKLCEPLMARQPAGALLTRLFGQGAGAGAALLFFGLGLAGVAVCLGFGLALRREAWQDPPVAR